jgi:hypothetical protein
LALLDPPRWGWTATGGVADLLPPHEVCFKHSCAQFSIITRYLA